jgi:hypothetical protein
LFHLWNNPLDIVPDLATVEMLGEVEISPVEIADPAAIVPAVE